MFLWFYNRRSKPAFVTYCGQKVVNSYDDNGQVEVELEVGGKTLWARISPWARDELAIKPGLWLYAQIKSVSITA